MSNSASKRSALTRLWKVELLVLAVAGVVCWRFPLFHLVPLRQAQQEQQAAVFDAAKVAAD